jgi:hypothetical protein
MKFWIARDKSGFLYLYDEKPIFDGEDWLSNGFYTILDLEYFPEVTFESSPQEVELKLTSENISECIVNEFMNTLNFTYDKSEKCMSAKVYNADLISLKNIIESKLN